MLPTNVVLALSDDLFEELINQALALVDQERFPRYKTFKKILSDLVTQIHFSGGIPSHICEGVSFRSDSEYIDFFMAVCSDLERKLEMESHRVRNCWRNRSARGVSGAEVPQLGSAYL